MKIGIIGAMLEETRIIMNNMKVLSEETIGMRTYYSGKLFDKDIVLVFSRWGKVAASSTVTTLIQKYGVDLVLFTGVAGAARSDLNIGDIVIAEKLVQHDMDATALPGFGEFEIPLLGKSYFEVDDSLLKCAVKSARQYIDTEITSIPAGLLNEFGIKRPTVLTGTIASGDQFIGDSRKIQELSEKVENLLCVEMEGAAVAQVCFEHNIEFIVLRVISDKANEHANIDFPKFIENAASRFTYGIIKQLISAI